MRAWLFASDETADAVARVLGPLGFAVERAADADAVASCATLAVVEWAHLGAHAADAVRALARAAGAPLVVVAADNATLTDALAAGAADAVILPADAARLAARARALPAAGEALVSWREVFACHPLPTLLYDEDTLALVAVNDAMVHAYGWTRQELLAMTLHDLRPLSERARFSAFMSQTERPAPGTWTHHRKDGTLIEVEVLAAKVHVPGRRVRLVVAQDISKHVRLEEAHRRSLFDYRRFIERTADAVFTYAPNGRVVDGNPAFVAMLGRRSLDEIVGRPITDFIHADDHDEVHARMRTTLVRQQSTVPGPIRFVAADGKICWTEARGIRVTYEGGAGVTVIARDLTERRASDEELRLSEERFSKVFKASPACISVTRASDDRFIDVNNRFAEATGYTREELIGRTGVEIGLWESPDVRNGLAQAVRGGKVLRDVSVRLKRKSGQPIDFLMSLETFFAAGVECVVALGHDVTERKQLEEQLRQTQKMDAIGRLAGGVAHDFNNLLTAIRGYCELLLQQLAPATPPHDAATHIHRSTLRAASLTGQLLALTRRQPHQPRVVVLNDIVTSMAALLGRIIGEDITLALDLSPELPRVRVDPAQLEQVLLNLAVNGRDAMARGGRLVIETANLTDGDGDHVRLTVRDSGAGMSDEVRGRVFEPFFTTKEVGTGLGLSIVYNIVLQNGGSISVDSSPGAGAAFHILLPRASDSPTIEPRAAARGPAAGGRETILLVEDDDDVRDFVSFVLRRAGYHVLTAQDGATAVRTAAAHGGSIALLLSDVIMPGTNGIELTAQLLPSRPGMKVLHMSGYPGESIARHGAIPPGAAFLQKPFSSEELTEAVRQALDR